MLAGGDGKSCTRGIYSSSRYYSDERLRVPDCLKEIIKQTKKPHGVVSGKAGRPADSFEYDAIVELKECRENEIYNSMFGDNEDSAKQCAKALTILTDVKHEAFMLRSRLFWRNLYQVRKAK